MTLLMGIPSFACQVVAAAAILILAVWAPGKLLVRRLKLTLEPTELLICSLGCGVCLLALVYWVLNLLQVPFLILGYAVVCFLIELWHARRGVPSRRPIISWRSALDALRGNWLILAVVGLSVFSQVRFLFAGGWFGTDGMILPSFHVHDGPGHIFLVHQLSRVFPPEAIGFAGERLQNYHYFTDLFWGAISRMAAVDPWHIYFRIAPPFYGAFTTLAAFAVGRALYEDRRIAYLATFICVLVSDFSYFFPLLMGYEKFPTWNGIFMVQPPLTGMAALTSGCAYPLTLVGFWALASWIKKRRHGFLMVLGLVWGTLPEFNIYPAVLVTAGLLVVGTARLILNRDGAMMKAFLAVLPLNVILFSVFNSGSASILRFMPGFNLASFLVLTKIVSPLSLVQFYEHHPVLLGLIMGGLVLAFTIGTLGIRCAALPSLARAALFPRSSDSLLLFLVVVTGGALAASMCFIQAGVPINTIQFFFYAVLLLAFPAAEQVWAWISKWKPGLRMAVLILYLGLGLPGTIKAWFGSTIVTEKYSLSKAECDALLWIRRNTTPDEILIRPPPPGLLTDAGYASWLAKAQWRNKRTLSDWRQVAEQYKVGGGSSDSRETAAGGTAPSNTDESAETPGTGGARLTVTPVAWGDTPYVAATTFRRTFVEDTETARAQMMNDEPEKRVRASRHFYLTSSAQDAGRFLQEHGITIVIQDAHRELPFPPSHVPLNVVYSNAAMVVYRFESKGIARPWGS